MAPSPFRGVLFSICPGNVDVSDKKTAPTGAVLRSNHDFRARIHFVAFGGALVAGRSTFTPNSFNFATAFSMESLFGKLATTDCHSRMALTCASAASQPC